MKFNQINPVLTVFRDIVLLEDEVTPSSSGKDSTASKMSRLKQAVAEKRALIQRTHKAVLSLTLTDRVKPVTFAAAAIYDVKCAQDSDRVSFITCKTSPTDSSVAYPSGIEVFALESIIDVQLSDIEDAAMAAVSNVAMAQNVSERAKRIVDALGLNDIVASLKKAQEAQLAPTAGSGMTVLWFPMNGWSDRFRQTVPTAFDTPYNYVAPTTVSELPSVDSSVQSDFTLPPILITPEEEKRN